jgi:hypothetical protein
VRKIGQSVKQNIKNNHMARTVSDIQVSIQNELVANFAAIGLTIDPTKWSKRNILRLLCFTFATVSNYLEQLMDVLNLSIQTTASQAAAASPLWIQAQMLLFQYSATNPQILQLINTVPQYPVIDTTLRIITACSVTSVTPNDVTIKVAKGSPFAALSSPELAAAQGFINLKGSAGINYIVASKDSDKIYVNANIYYQGQYSAVIQTNVIAALNLFLQNLSVNNFDGSLKMTDLEATIRNVIGVNDVVLLNVRGREDTSIFSAGIDLILNQTTILRLWQTVAGYVGQENTSGKTFADSLNFIAE